jgi:hypothetical protein
VTETLEEFLTGAHERSMTFKTTAVAEGGRDAPTPFVVSGNRGDQHVASFFPGGRDEMLWTVRLVIGVFGCDRVAGTMDAWSCTEGLGTGAEPLNPDTGKPFEQGDMQRAWEAKRPWVSETLMTHGVDRVEQKMLVRVTPYRVKHRRVRYADTQEIDGLGGLVPDALRQAMNAPDMMAVMRAQLGQPIDNVFDLSPKEQRAHADVVAIRWCAAQEIPVLYAVDDPDVRGIMEMSLTDEELSAAFGVPGLQVHNIIPGLRG